MPSSKLTTRRATPRKPIVCHSKDKYRPELRWIPDYEQVSPGTHFDLDLYLCRPSHAETVKLSYHTGPFQITHHPDTPNCDRRPAQFLAPDTQGTYQIRVKAVWEDGVVAFAWATIDVRHVP